MAITQALLSDIDLMYRNSFTPSQKLVWMTEEQDDLFEILEIDLSPIAFPLQTDVQFYPIPTGVDNDRIKTMTIQTNDADLPEFSPLVWRRNDDRQYVEYAELYYSIVGGSFFIPNGTIDDRQVYIYLDKPPAILVLGEEPSVPVRYQELLKLGTLKRIAMARKDVLMKNSYEADYQEKIGDLILKMKQSDPEFSAPIDMLPRSSRHRTGRYDRRYFSH